MKTTFTVRRWCIVKADGELRMEGDVPQRYLDERTAKNLCHTDGTDRVQEFEATVSLSPVRTLREQVLDVMASYSQGVSAHQCADAILAIIAKEAPHA